MSNAFIPSDHRVFIDKSTTIDSLTYLFRPDHSKTTITYTTSPFLTLIKDPSKTITIELGNDAPPSILGFLSSLMLESPYVLTPFGEKNTCSRKNCRL